MGIFGKTLKVLLDVVETPVAIVKDVATLGGTLTDNGETYTGAKMDELADDYDELREEITEL